ncbi:MAG: hypothetical protein H8E66_33285 [Planctomycetes bacterium]|nr:hypothetical protein [Planctomycetota bacterium]
MGYDQDQRSSSSGALVALLVVGLVVVILGVLAVAGAGLFYVKASSQQSQAVAVEQQVVAETRQAAVIDRIRQLSTSPPVAPGPRLSFLLELDREGNMSVASEMIGLDELRPRLVKFKDESGNTFLFRITADSECPAKHIIAVLDVCDKVGEIDVRIVSSKASDTPLGEGDAGN